MYAFPLDDETKKFMVCDMWDDRDFLDPLIFFHQPGRDPYKVNSEGIFAIGGKITPEKLIESYKWGIFPWFAYRLNEEVYWYCPENRFVIFPDKFHIGHSLRNLLNKKRYHITINKAFEEVIHHCRKVNDRDENVGAWLSDEIETSFLELHKRGYAKSVEVWEVDELIGGFYGFFYKGVFEGDSMFSLKPSASQVGLAELCRNPYIDGIKIEIIDTQFESPTFKRLGGEYISYEKYRDIMERGR